MIDGVRVLFEYTQPSDVLALWVIIGISAFVAFVCVTVEYSFKTSVAFGAMAALMLWFCFWPVTTPRYQYYKVMLDGASYSALVERYEVTDTEGEILIVREKR